MANTTRPNHPTIAQKWDLFQTLVIPSTASKLQVSEMRRSFYCGFQDALRLLSEDVADMPADQAMATLSNLIAEANAFGRSIQQGKA